MQQVVRTRRACAFALAILLAMRPRPGISATESLDLGACRARALGSAPELASAAAEADASRLNVRIATGGFLPSLRAEGGYLHSSVDRHGMVDFVANNGEHEYIARAVLTQPIYTGGTLTATRNKARAEATGAEQGLASARAQVVLATDRAYFGVLASEEKRVVVGAALDTAEELLRAARVRLQNGEIAAFDVAKLELEVATATSARSAADVEVAIARSGLAILIDLPPDGFTLAPLDPGDDAATNLATLDEMLARALAERPDVKRAKAELQAAAHAVGVARGARMPQLTAQAAGGYDSLDPPDRRNAGWEAGVAVSVPLWDWNVLANRERIASLDVERARRRLEAAERALRAAVTERYLQARLARERIETSGAATQLAERNADIARRGYALGLVSSLDLVNTQRQATASRSEHASARYELRIALSELDFATGRLQ